MTRKFSTDNVRGVRDKYQVCPQFSFLPRPVANNVDISFQDKEEEEQESTARVKKLIIDPHMSKSYGIETLTPGQRVDTLQIYKR